jgi:hypothetical protein
VIALVDTCEQEVFPSSRSIAIIWGLRKKVFLSHSTKDKQFVQSLADELKREQIESWLCEIVLNWAKISLRKIEVHDVAAPLRGATIGRPEEQRRLLNAMAACALEGFWFPLTVEIAGLTESEGRAARKVPVGGDPGCDAFIRDE